MKLHELANKLKVEKETENAVLVNNKKLTEEDYNTVEEIWRLGVNVYIKNNGFWFPKSQIGIENGYVTKMTLWLYNKLSNNYWDFPTILKEELEPKGDE